MIRSAYGISYVHFNRLGGENLLAYNGPYIVDAQITQDPSHLPSAPRLPPTPPPASSPPPESATRRTSQYRQLQPIARAGPLYPQRQPHRVRANLAPPCSASWRGASCSTPSWATTAQPHDPRRWEPGTPQQAHRELFAAGPPPIHNFEHRNRLGRRQHQLQRAPDQTREALLRRHHAAQLVHMVESHRQRLRTPGESQNRRQAPRAPTTTTLAQRKRTLQLQQPAPQTTRRSPPSTRCPSDAASHGEAIGTAPSTPHWAAGSPQFINNLTSGLPINITYSPTSHSLPERPASQIGGLWLI